MNNSAESINEWHKLARPTPDEKAFNVQLGCHFEEVAEMVASLDLVFDDFPETKGKQSMLYAAIEAVATGLKNGSIRVVNINRKEMLDSIGDQVVTGIGVGHCLGLKTLDALAEINRSNWSKFVDGRPVFNEHGKIAKPATYTPPNLEGMY